MSPADPSARRGGPSTPRTLAMLACWTALALLPGCGWARALGADATEVLSLGVGASRVPSVYVNVSLPLLGTSVGYLPDSTYVGLDAGYTSQWHQAGVGVLLGGQLVRTEYGHPIHDFDRGMLEEAYLEQSQYFLLNLVVRDVRTATAPSSVVVARVDLAVHVLFVGASVGVDLLELADVLCGVVGYDLLGDDAHVPLRAPFPMPGLEADDLEATPDAPRKRSRARKQDGEAEEGGTPSSETAP